MKINITNDTDTTDGREPSVQAMLGISYILAIIASWYLLKIVQYGCVNFMTEDQDAALKWLESEAYLLWNLLFWGGFWIWALGRVVRYQGPNSAYVTMDSINPKELASGGTEYTVYGPGVSFLPATAIEGFETEIEKEDTLLGKEFTCSVKKISLKMQLMCIWSPLPRRLSVYFQNGKTDAERMNILVKGIMTLAKEMAEVTASKFKSAEHARAGQRKIADKIEEEIIPLAEEYGFQIKKFGFENCDYPEDVQALLNKGIVAMTLADITERLIGEGVSPDKAAELAAIYAGINGITIKREVYQLEADEHISEALKAAGPAMAALVAAWKVIHPNKAKPTTKPTKQKGKKTP